MFIWSVLAVMYLSVVGMTGQARILLWPAVAVHAGAVCPSLVGAVEGTKNAEGEHIRPIV